LNGLIRGIDPVLSLAENLLIFQSEGKINSEKISLLSTHSTLSTFSGEDIPEVKLLIAEPSNKKIQIDCSNSTSSDIIQTLRFRIQPWAKSFFSILFSQHSTSTPQSKQNRNKKRGLLVESSLSSSNPSSNQLSSLSVSLQSTIISYLYLHSPNSTTRLFLINELWNTLQRSKKKVYF
jgi:hypothetical protein